MTNENSKLDSERAAFEAAFDGEFFSSCFEREDDGTYAGRGLQGAWMGWQKARASQPVGGLAAVIDKLKHHGGSFTINCNGEPVATLTLSEAEQQSSPERVVDCDKALSLLNMAIENHGQWLKLDPFLRDLRALLAIHSEGGKV